MGWNVLVLIPDRTTDTWNIGLLETLWKVAEALIDTGQRASLQFHDGLHGFRSRGGMGAAIMKLKLAQELARADHKPLFLVVLDLWKAYDTVDRDRLIQTLEVYGAGPHMCGLLETLWDHQKVAPIKNSYHRPAFSDTWGTIQGGLVSPPLFNVVVDNVIRTWLAMTVKDQRLAHNRLGETVGWCLGVFYADDGMV